MRGLLVALALLFTASAVPFTFEMSPTGSDIVGCGLGAPAPPCVTFDFALTRAVALAGAANASVTFALTPGWYNASCGAVWNDTQMLRVDALRFVATAPGVIVNCRGLEHFVAVYAKNGTVPLAVELRGFSLRNTNTNVAGRSGGFFILPTNRPVTTTVTSMMFSSNTGAGGGALDLYGSATVTNCTFESNSGLDGGALAITTSSFVAQSSVVHSTFVGNTAAGAGGALIIRGAVHAILGNLTVTKNSALLGGGICVNVLKTGGPTPVGWQLTLRANTAAAGGGVYFSRGGVFWTDVLLEANVARSYGGGLYASRLPDFTLLRGTLRDNVAGFRGGGGFLFLAITFVIDTCVLSNNVVLSPSSAVDAVGGSFYLKLATGAALFPRTTLESSLMSVGRDTSGDAILRASSSELFCDDTTATLSCVMCFAKSCSVCAARSVGCVRQAGQAVFCPAALATEITTTIPNVTHNVCSCGGPSPSRTCSGNGYCWWKSGSRGTCLCKPQWVGSSCNFPLKVVLALTLVLGPLCIGLVALGVYFVIKIRRNNKLIAALDAESRKNSGSIQPLMATDLDASPPSPKAQSSFAPGPSLELAIAPTSSAPMVSGPASSSSSSS